MARLGRIAPIGVAVALVALGCSSSSDDGDDESTTTAAVAASTTVPPPATTVAAVSTTLSATTTAADNGIGQVPPGQDPRAHVVSIDPYATADATVGLSVTFAEPWGPEPPFDPFSFFVLFNAVQLNLSLEAGWQIHDQVVTPLGPGPTWMTQDGRMLIETPFPIAPAGALIEIDGENGSWTDPDASAVFGTFHFVVDPSEPLEPHDMSIIVWDLVAQTPFPGGGPP